MSELKICDKCGKVLTVDNVCEERYELGITKHDAHGYTFYQQKTIDLCARCYNLLKGEIKKNRGKI